MHNNQFLSNYIIKQFDVKKFKKMIKAFLSIVDNFQNIIDKDEYYIKYTTNYEMYHNHTISKRKYKLC